MAGKKNEVVDNVAGSPVAVVNPANAVFADGEPTNTPGEMLQPLAEPEGGWPADEFTGLDGCFVRDRFTGVRSRVVSE